MLNYYPLPYINNYVVVLVVVVVVVVGRAHLSGRALSLFFRWLSFFLAILNGRVVSVFFPKTTTTAAILNGRVVSIFFPKTTTTCICCINRSSNHGTIMWLLYEPTIITNLLYFLIKCIPGRVRSGRSEVRICTQIRR